MKLHWDVLLDRARNRRNRLVDPVGNLEPAESMDRVISILDWLVRSDATHATFLKNANHRPVWVALIHALIVAERLEAEHSGRPSLRVRQLADDALVYAIRLMDVHRLDVSGDVLTDR